MKGKRQWTLPFGIGTIYLFRTDDSWAFGFTSAEEPKHAIGALWINFCRATSSHLMTGERDVPTWRDYNVFKTPWKGSRLIIWPGKPFRTLPFPYLFHRWDVFGQGDGFQKLQWCNGFFFRRHALLYAKKLNDLEVEDEPTAEFADL